MRYLELKKEILQNIFTIRDVIKFFPEEKSATTRNQLSRLAKSGQIYPLKRGVYCFDPSLITDLELAKILAPDSYISLESALNYYGIIPDIPLSVTSITLAKGKNIKNRWGNFLYFHFKKELFFGFQAIKDQENGNFFNLAYKEKALFDYFYLRKIRKLSGLRLQLKRLDFKKYHLFAQSFPDWVSNIKLNEQFSR